MAPTPKTKTATTRRKTASRETTSLDRAVGRESERLIKENERLQDQIREMKVEDEHKDRVAEILRDNLTTAKEERAVLRSNNERLQGEHERSCRAVGRLKSEIVSLRTERDTYRGALAAYEPEVERNLSERIGGVIEVPQMHMQTLPMVNQRDPDFEEVDRPHWFDL